MPETPEKRLVNPDGSAKDRIVGFETEYALRCSTPNGYDPESLNHGVIRSARKLCEEEYVEDGGRIYVDVGDHPEYATAEEISFLGSAHRLLAGHLAMSGLYAAAAEDIAKTYSMQIEQKPIKVDLGANTRDSAGNSWGNHSNVLAPRALRPDDYITALAAHNLSRIVWSGAGKVQMHQDGSFGFELSEKADQIVYIASSATMGSRPLVNLRDESHANDNDFRRIHDTAGETIFSSHANALRLATTSIILRACELGVNFDSLFPTDPIEAINEISEDPTLKVKVAVNGGRRRLTGLELQMELAERSLSAGQKHDYLTVQEKEWGQNWIKLLDDLKIDIDKCSTRVDWITKKHIVEREVEARAKSDQRPSTIALQAAVAYHRLLPVEGKGLQLVRKGFFQDSPSTDTIDEGLSLPQTRARLRGRAIGALKASKRYWGASWTSVFLRDASRLQSHMINPYATQNTGVDELIAKIAA